MFLLIHGLERQITRLLQIQRWKSQVDIIRRLKSILRRLVCKITAMYPYGTTLISLSAEGSRKKCYAFPVDPEMVLTGHMSQPAGPGQGP